MAQSNPEQEALARMIAPNGGYVCMRLNNTGHDDWSWDVERVFSLSSQAEWWFDSQPKGTRIYLVPRGQGMVKICGAK